MFERTSRVQILILILYKVHIYAGVKQNFTGQVGKDDKVTKYEKNENLVYSMKAKGKGAFGGANVVHRPRDTKNMAALGSTNPSLFTTIIFASLTLGWSFGYGYPI